MYKIEDLIGKYAARGKPCFLELVKACDSLSIKQDNLDSLMFDFIEVIEVGGVPVMFGVERAESLEVNSEPFTPKPQWSPETNTLHTIRLSGEQFARLYEAEIAGGQRFAVEGGNAVKVSNHTWFPDAVYQVNTKSEREAFIERSCSEAGLVGINDGSNIMGKLFDAGCRFVDAKAPEVE